MNKYDREEYQNVLEKALALDVEDRRRLMYKLNESLPETQELSRRLDENFRKSQEPPRCDGTLSSGKPCQRKFDHDGICKG